MNVRKFIAEFRIFALGFVFGALCMFAYLLGPYLVN